MDRRSRPGLLFRYYGQLRSAISINYSVQFGLTFGLLQGVTAKNRERESCVAPPWVGQHTPSSFSLALAGPGRNTISREMTPVKFILQKYLV